MKSVYFVKGSAAEPYEVVFLKEGKTLKVTCTCKAGQNHTVCKHRVGLISGSPENVDLNSSSSIEEIDQLLVGSNLFEIYKKYVDLTHEFERVKKLHASQKKAFARIMKDGA